MTLRDIRYPAAIVHDHHILLGKVYDRNDRRQRWILPGSGREGGEDAATCLRREAREETGLDVEPAQLLFVTPDIPEGGYAELYTYLCAERKWSYVRHCRVQRGNVGTGNVSARQIHPQSNAVRW